MGRRPPDFGGESVAARAERVDDRREQQRLADGNDLGAEALLRRLRPEGREVGRDHVAGDDLGIDRLERRDLRREVVVHQLIAAGIGEPVAGLCKRRRQAVLRIPPGIAVGVIGEQAAHDFVGRRRIPEREKRPDDVLKSPKEMIGPGEPLGRIALAAEEIRLPGTIGGDAGDLVDLGLIGDRIGGVRRRRRDDEVDLVAEDQLGGDLGGAAAARLAVLADDLHLIGAPAALQPVGENTAHLFQDESVGFTEACERAGPWTDVADLRSTAGAAIVPSPARTSVRREMPKLGSSDPSLPI